MLGTQREDKTNMIDDGIVVTDLKQPEQIEPSVTDTEPSMNFLNDWFELSAIDRLAVENSDRIRYIYDYVKGLGKNDPMSVFQYLRDVSYKLGAPRLGMSKLQHIYQFVKIQNQRQVLDLKESELRNDSSQRPE